MCVLQLIVIIIIAELNDGQPNVIRTNKMLCGAAFLLWTCALGDDANKNTHVQDKWHGLSWTLQIGLPLTGLAFFLIYGGFLPSLLLQIDRCCVSVFCPSLSKREKLLRWVSNRLPWTWSFRTRPLTSGVPELWKDGSLLCTLINSAIPGACPNPHRHWKKPPLHAQALAYKYLDLAPIFTEQDFKNDLSAVQEGNFLSYLQKLQQAINKLNDDNENEEKVIRYSNQYVARGMGLYTGEQYRKTVFYIYSDTIGPAKKRSGVLIHIRGPYNTQGKATIPPFHNLERIPVVCQMEASKILPAKNHDQRWFLKTISLDFTSLMTANQDGEEKTNDIPLKIDMELNRAKVTYIPNNTGIYELNLITNGELLQGSPYYIRITENLTAERDVFEEEIEEIEDGIVVKKKRTLSRVIDCVDEIIDLDDDKNAKITMNQPEIDGDDVTIMQITRNDDEIVKTEISCTLEEIQEEKILFHKDSPRKKEQIVVESDEKLVLLPPEAEFQVEEKFIVDCVDNFVDAVVKIDVSEQKARLERQRKISDDHQIKLNLSANVNEEQQPLKIQLEPQPKSTSNPNIEEKPLKKILSSDNIFYVDYEETDGSSPICAEQIAKEENVPSAKQRRKLFQFPQPEFSHAENGDTMETEDSCFNSLNSTLSLPEISTVKERKAFWEQKIRSSTESLDKEVPDKNLFQNIRHREKVNKYQIELMSKSNEECNSIKDFEIFNLMSLEDRKKMLLEKMDKADKRKTKNSIKKLNVERMESFDEVDHETISPKEVFEPISERIDRFDKNNLPNQNQKNDRKKRNNFKAHFKRAFNFFRSLEESPKRNNTRSIMQPIQRRHSLDTHVNNLKGNNKVRKGGSLSERFSINNLFDDVFGSWNKGSFKGTPNKQAVIRSLSSFGESPDALVISNRIQYNLFANKNKARRRKSLKSIFDVNY